MPRRNRGRHRNIRGPRQHRPTAPPPGPARRNFVVVGHRAATSPRFTLTDLPGSAGRLDLLCRCVNSALCLSNGLRRDSQLWMVLQGPPGPPVTIRFDGGNARYLNPDERSTGALVRHALIKLEEEEQRALRERNVEAVTEAKAEGEDEAGAGSENGDETQEPHPKIGELERTPGVYVSRTGLAETLERLATAGARMVLLEEGADEAKGVLEDLLATMPGAGTGNDDGTTVDKKAEVDDASKSGGCPWAFIMGDDRDLTEGELALVNDNQIVRAGLGPLSLLTSHCIVLVQTLLDELERVGAEDA